MTDASQGRAATRSAATEYDAVVVGAGVAGLYQIYRLRERGLAVRGIVRRPTWVVPGTGTATRARASIRSPISTSTGSPRN